MKNELMAEYEKEQELTKAYQLAEERGEDEIQEALREEYNNLMKSIIDKGIVYAKIYDYYKSAKERGNEYMDLNEAMTDEDAIEFMQAFRELNIDSFTYSSVWSSAIEAAWQFTKHGFELAGMLKINGVHKAFLKDEYEQVPAYLFKKN